MGMFDRVVMDVRCPYCGEVNKREIQTKDGKCLLNLYKVGDYFDEQLKYIKGTTSCRSDVCNKYMEEWEKKNKYFRGFGRLFEVKIYLKKGYITNKIKIIKMKEYLLVWLE